jgi:hypothetical protein
VASGKHSLSHTEFFKWHSHFKAGRLSVEDDKHSERLSTSNIPENVEKISELAHEDRHSCHQLQSLPGDLNRKFEHALHCCEVYSLTLYK